MGLAGWPCVRCGGPLAGDGGCPRCAAGPSLPWEDLADAGERLEAARRRRDLAAPDTPAAAAADLDVLEAEQDLRAAHHRFAVLGSLLFAAATQGVPDAGWLCEHSYLNRPSVERFLAVAGLDGLDEELGDLTQWVRRLYGQVEQLKAENWQLANAVYDLRAEVRELKGAVGHGQEEPDDHRPGRDQPGERQWVPRVV